ncbi:MAG: PD40 domain-containing protein [Verrucomicrobia bacterium]|nr:PD40 domain-containing protein [Verrucomicrobiota bacterium]
MFYLALGTWSWSASAADGFIYYNQIAMLNAPATLHRVNADGTDNQALPVNLPAALYPAASRDGLRLLLTSTDPGRPFKISNNVFLQDLPTGLLGRITSFEDVVQFAGGIITTNDLGQTNGNRNVSGYTINFPYHKAFSPDGSRVVVMNLRKTGSVTRDSPISSTNGPGQLYVGSGRVPVAEVYRVADGQPEGAYVFLGIERDGFNQGGDGVDWHPFRNEVIVTAASDIPATGNAGRTGMEGTLLAIFSISAQPQFVRKLTTPSGRADAFFDATALVSSAYAEHDYAPAISPDGQRVAYVRHTLRQDTRYDGAGIAPLPAQCAIRVINYDGSGDHEIVHLVDGLWITKIAWSPGGSQIALDLAPQAVLNGLNSLLGDVTRSEIHVVNADGSDAHRLIAAPAAFPTWAPGSLPRPVIRAIRNGNTLELEMDQLVPGRQIQIEGTTDLQTWNVVSTVTASATSQTIPIALIDQNRLAFYRIRVF